jgi:Beta-L-arabinofuranosidase, GH127
MARTRKKEVTRHLIEAAVVHFEATGQDRLLRVAQRFADHLVACFGREPGQIRGYCGHPEIELALLRVITSPKSVATSTCKQDGRHFHLDTRPFLSHRWRKPWKSIRAFQAN